MSIGKENSRPATQALRDTWSGQKSRTHHPESAGVDWAFPRKVEWIEGGRKLKDRKLGRGHPVMREMQVNP
jgi:hypothetical protein